MNDTPVIKAESVELPKTIDIYVLLCRWKNCHVWTSSVHFSLEEALKAKRNDSDILKWEHYLMLTQLPI